MNPRIASLALLASLAACSDATSTTPAEDASTDVSASDVSASDVSASDTPTSDAPTRDVPPADVAGDGGACAASDAGTLQRNYYCDFGAIHVLQHDGAAAEVQVEARVGTGGGCGVVDSVEIVRGATTLQRFDVGAAFTPGSMGAALGRAMALPALVSECANETTRLSAYGIIVRGRNEMGPFEARCGTAESGSRWPPGTHLACHRNVDRPPMTLASTQITVMPVGPTTSAMLSVMVPHAEGRPALTTVSGTLRVVSPQYAAFSSGAPLMSLDSTGWTGNAGESSTPSPVTQVQMFATGMNPLPSALCPPPMNPMPGVTPMLPPYFLARITGMGPSGAVTIEALASCVTFARR